MCRADISSKILHQLNIFWATGVVKKLTSLSESRITINVKIRHLYRKINFCISRTCTNKEDSEKLPLLMMVKSENPRWVVKNVKKEASWEHFKH